MAGATDITEATMGTEICLGAYATSQEALDAKASRPEPEEQLAVIEDNYDPEHPWRLWWFRPAEA